MKEVSYSKILVAVDGSDHAEKAFYHAMSIAQKFGSKVTVINVMAPPVAGGGMGHFPVQKVVQEKFDSADSLASKFSSIARQEYGIAIETVTKGGVVVEEILKAAESDKVDLIVMGSRGLTGFKELVLGSVSSAVVHRAKVPVLTVK